MPVNSFEDYPMSWRPDKNRLRRPYFQSIADAMEEDIVSGVLPPQTKLPPQRELSDFLDINLSTITRAYKLCALKGLIYAATGSGTFVRSSQAENASLQDAPTQKMIELGTIQPFYQLNTTVLKTAQRILEKPQAVNLLEYAQPFDNVPNLRAARQWLANFNIEVPTDRILIAPGGQNALAVVLISLFQPGDKIAVESYTYQNFIGLANLLHIQLMPVKTDECGMLPEALDQLCRSTSIKGVFLMPACSNPTSVTMPPERRNDLATVICQHNLILVEDETYSFLLPESYIPLAAQIPEQTVCVCGTSKSLCAGLRVAYIAFPGRFASALSNGYYYANLKTAAINVQIISDLIASGAAKQIAEKKARLAKTRNEIYRNYFPEAEGFNERSFFQWLKLPQNMDGSWVESQAKSRGVHVLGSNTFAVGPAQACSYIRIATCSPKNTAELNKGLAVIREIIAQGSAKAPGFIV